MQKVLLYSSLLTIGLAYTFHDQTQAQVTWESIDSSKILHKPVIWETISESNKDDASETNWEADIELDRRVEDSTKILWELIDSNDDSATPVSQNSPNSDISRPSTLEEAEALLKNIPLQPSDYQSLTNLSYAVPTAEILEPEEWRLSAITLSPFRSRDGTGNQNYAIQLDYSLNDRLQISGFYSEADDPLNAQIKGFDIQPANFWEVFGAAARWKFKTGKNFSMAINGSLESWTVGSGGSNSLVNNKGDKASPNIFNDSGQRVETKNLAGSLALPFTWQANTKVQFTFAPGISFLPSSQGKGQGGAGEFYGTNPYISGGFLWQPNSQLGFVSSIAQPIGSGNNSFDRNLKYSRVPIISGGLNWHLNPRIALKGTLTNGFGATPATSILALPSDNRLGYNASFVFTADAPDTPQPELTSRQHSLSSGGLTVNTALVPADKTSITRVNADSMGNFEIVFAHSLSNIFQLDFYRSQNNGIPQSTVQAQSYMNDGAINWRGSGKAVLTSQLRGAPVWSALRMSFGRNTDIVNNTGQGYLFAETPVTWEACSKISINFNPKVAWTGVGTLWGVGLGANIQLRPHWELIPEINMVINSHAESNSTLGLRWNTTEDFAVEIYGSTASSLSDIGQLLNADQVRWGGRLITKF